MCGYFSTEVTDFMFTGKKLTDFTSMFSIYDFEKNGTKILSYFKDEWNWLKKLDWSIKIQIEWNQ